MAKRREKGDGSIYQRESDGRYVAYARLENGKKKYVYDKTRSGVAKKLKELQKSIEAGTVINAKPESVEVYLLYWLDIHKSQIKETTYTTYKNHLRSVYPHIGHIKLQKLVGDHLQKMYADFAENMSSNTVRLIHTILSAAFKQAVRWKRLVHNPCQDIDPPTLEKPKERVLTPEQAQNLLAVAKDSSLECFLVLALTTGMRRGELLGLRWDDIDFEQKTLSVARTVSYLKTETNGIYHYIETSPKTEAGRRIIALTRLGINTLKVHKIKQLEQRLAVGSAWHEHGLVIPNSLGNIYDISSLRFRFNKLLQKAGLPHMRIHDLRHCAATLLLSMGVELKVIQQILGHSSIAITANIYGHVLLTLQEEAMSKMDDLFSCSN